MHWRLNPKRVYYCCCCWGADFNGLLPPLFDDLLVLAGLRPRPRPRPLLPCCWRGPTSWGGKKCGA